MEVSPPGSGNTLLQLFDMTPLAHGSQPPLIWRFVSIVEVIQSGFWGRSLYGEPIGLVFLSFSFRSFFQVGVTLALYSGPAESAIKHLTI